MTEPKRILLCPSAYYPNFGGVEEICRNLADQLSERGYTVAIAVNRWPADTPDFEELWGIPVYRFDLGGPSKRHLLGTWRMFPRAGKFNRFLSSWKPDIIHVICPSTTGFYLWAAQHSHRAKVLLTFQGELFMDAHDIYNKSWFAGWSVKKLLEVAHGITACSQFVLDDAARRYALPAVPTEVVFNGVQLGEGSNTQRAERAYVLGVGRVVKNKGFNVLITAFSKIASQFPGIDLVLAGDGDELENLKKLASSLNLSDRVIFTGRKQRDEIATLFSNSRFFVLPSPCEPFGIVALEAMRAGKPVIACNAGGPPEFIQHGSNGMLVEPGDADALAQAMCALLTDTDFTDKLGQRALQDISAFSWRKITEQYTHIYAKLSAAAGRQRELAR
jgi:glycosyltransferase involved in cell wall biosynthesis